MNKNRTFSFEQSANRILRLNAELSNKYVVHCVDRKLGCIRKAVEGFTTQPPNFIFGDLNAII
jgi:hypothetical protein